MLVNRIYDNLTEMSENFKACEMFNQKVYDSLETLQEKLQYGMVDRSETMSHLMGILKMFNELEQDY